MLFSNLLQVSNPASPLPRSHNTPSQKSNTTTPLGAVGIPGYALKGIYEEVQKPRGIDPGKEKLEKEKDIREQLMLRGFKEWKAASEKEREKVYEWLLREKEDIETMNFGG